MPTGVCAVAGAVAVAINVKASVAIAAERIGQAFRNDALVFATIRAVRISSFDNAFNLVTDYTRERTKLT